MINNPQNAGDTPAWKKLALSLTSDPLAKTRDTANKWTSILSALVGLSTVFGLIQGRDALNKLSTVFQFLLVAVFILALLASVKAIYLAALASEGTPELVPLDKENFLDWYQKATNQAISYFQRSRRLALAAVVLVVLGLFIVWFAPGPPNMGASILVVQKSGKVLCGTLARDTLGNLTLTSNTQTITLQDVVSINVVSKCP
jgi:hypothetical protein